MTAKEKILQYIDYKGITKRDFYRQTGLSNGFLDSGKHIGSDNIKIIISTYPEINIEWLVMDNGEMLKTKSEENVLKKNEDKNEDNFEDKPKVKKMPPNETFISSTEVDLLKQLLAEKDKRIEELQNALKEQKMLYEEHITILKNMPLLGDSQAAVG